jgi:hypothetical protein
MTLALYNGVDEAMSYGQLRIIAAELLATMRSNSGTFG